LQFFIFPCTSTWSLVYLKHLICESTVHRVDLLAGGEPDEAVAPVSQKCRPAHKGAAFTIHHKKSATIVFFRFRSETREIEAKIVSLESEKRVFFAVSNRSETATNLQRAVVAHPGAVKSQ
jgi:hypothetical protein